MEAATAEAVMTCARRRSTMAKHRSGDAITPSSSENATGVRAERGYARARRLGQGYPLSRYCEIHAGPGPDRRFHRLGSFALRQFGNLTRSPGVGSIVPFRRQFRPAPHVARCADPARPVRLCRPQLLGSRRSAARRERQRPRHQRRRPAAHRVVQREVRKTDRPSRFVCCGPDVTLANPDIVLLQEMDEAGTAAIADSLGMNWIYYPASVASHHDFGNAILSCWPLEQDTRSCCLTRPSSVATDASRWPPRFESRSCGSRLLRAPGHSLWTGAERSSRAARDRARRRGPLSATSSSGATSTARRSRRSPSLRGYAWPTRRLPHTAKWWTVDHILLKGDLSADSSSAGVVRDNLKASDHRPVWVAVSLHSLNGSTRDRK